MRLAPGVQVTSSIELVSPIAEGAMGSVWVAFHHGLHTRVAVKFVSDKLGDDTAEALARFELEARTAAQIKSAHVVQTNDCGLTPDGVPYMVMELLEGETLGDRMRRLGHLEVRETAIILTQIARALTKAHRIGIVHRDIKPDNVFLCRNEEGVFSKILDFGIAKQTALPEMGGLTSDGKMVGTPEYLSPEQVLEGHAADYRADLWALAVVAYVALTGYLPFTGKTVGQLSLALAGGQHVPASKLRHGLTPEVDAWFATALNRDPNCRFNSAREMAVTFVAALSDVDAEGINLGGATLFGSSVSNMVAAEDTERQFGQSHTTMPPPARGQGGVALRAAAVGALVSIIGVAAFVLSSDPTDGMHATTAVAGMSERVSDLADEAELAALRAQEAAEHARQEQEAQQEAPVAAVDRDNLTHRPRGSRIAASQPKSLSPKSQPPKSQSPKSQSPPAPPNPPSARSKKKTNAAGEKLRDKEELGF